MKNFESTGLAQISAKVDSLAYLIFAQHVAADMPHLTHEQAKKETDELNKVYTDMVADLTKDIPTVPQKQQKDGRTSHQKVKEMKEKQKQKDLK